MINIDCIITEGGTIEATITKDLTINVDIIGSGPQGPIGPKGDKGDKGDDGYTPIKGIDYFDGSDATDKHYIHNQIKSSNVWTIQHNLDKYPSVIIVDSSNSVVIGDITFIDKNSIIVSFVAEFSGKAYLN